MITRYQRAVRDYIADNYGVSPTWANGSKHPALTFDYDGIPRRITLAGSPSDDDKRAIDIKLGDVRRLLGAPPHRQPVAPRRKLEDMMAQVQLVRTAAFPKSRTPSSDLTVSIACYLTDGAPQICLFVPTSVLTATPHGVDVERSDPDSWMIRPLQTAPKHQAPRVHTKGLQNILKLPRAACAGLTPFGVSPGEIIEIDDGWLVRSPPEQRRPLDPRKQSDAKLRNKPKSRPTEKDIDAAISSLPKRTPAVSDTPIQTHQQSPPITPTDMLACLEAVAAIERTTPYRLVRTERGIEFRAPVVRINQQA